MKQLLEVFKECLRDKECKIGLYGGFGVLFFLCCFFLIVLMLGGMTFFQALSLSGLMYGLVFAFSGLYFWIMWRVGAVKLDDKRESDLERRKSE